MGEEDAGPGELDLEGAADPGADGPGGEAGGSHFRRFRPAVAVKVAGSDEPAAQGVPFHRRTHRPQAAVVYVCEMVGHPLRRGDHDLGRLPARKASTISATCAPQT